MDVLEFQKDFLEEVKSTASVEGSGSNAAFVSVASGYLIGAEVFLWYWTLPTGGAESEERQEDLFDDDLPF